MYANPLVASTSPHYMTMLYNSRVAEMAGYLVQPLLQPGGGRPGQPTQNNYEREPAGQAGLLSPDLEAAQSTRAVDKQWGYAPEKTAPTNVLVLRGVPPRAFLAPLPFYTLPTKGTAGTAGKSATTTPPGAGTATATPTGPRRRAG